MRIRFPLFLIAFWISLVQPLPADAQATAMPAFKMLLTNGKYYTAADLPKSKPVVLIYFAPDCDHCIQLMDAFFKKIESFKNAQVVLVTFKPISDLPLFERTYQTAKYPNIKVGTEGSTYYLRNFYKLQNTPFTALYDKEGKLVHSYRKDTLVPDLVKRLNTIP